MHYVAKVKDILNKLFALQFLLSNKPLCPSPSITVSVSGVSLTAARGLNRRIVSFEVVGCTMYEPAVIQSLQTWSQKVVRERERLGMLIYRLSTRL